MKRIIVVSACLLLFLSSSYAFGADGPYFSGNIGAAFLTDSDISGGGEDGELSFDTGFAVAGAIGTSIDSFRVEGEVSYQSNDIDEVSIDGLGSVDIDGDVTALSLLLNGYYDFSNDSAFTPYLTAGIGYSNVEVDFDDLGGSENDSVFAYQLGAGVGYAVTDNVTIDAKYRYFATEDPDFDGVDAEMASHNIYLGIRVNF